MLPLLVTDVSFIRLTTLQQETNGITVFYRRLRSSELENINTNGSLRASGKLDPAGPISTHGFADVDATSCQRRTALIESADQSSLHL